jgi:hypothetical protein
MLEGRMAQLPLCIAVPHGRKLDEALEALVQEEEMAPSRSSGRSRHEPNDWRESKSARAKESLVRARRAHYPLSALPSARPVFFPFIDYIIMLKRGKRAVALSRFTADSHGIEASSLNTQAGAKRAANARRQTIHNFSHPVSLEAPG